jgi:hypothetical protein
MKGLSVLVIVSALVVGTAGCRQCNWFGRPSRVMMPTTAYGSPAMPAATYVVPGATVPVTSPPSCGPGRNSSGSNTLPVLSDAQGYHQRWLANTSSTDLASPLLFIADPSCERNASAPQTLPHPFSSGRLSESSASSDGGASFVASILCVVLKTRFSGVRTGHLCRGWKRLSGTATSLCPSSPSTVPLSSRLKIAS